MMTVTGNHTLRVSIKDIYNKDYINIPDEYEFIEFRCIKPGDLYIQSGEFNMVREAKIGYTSAPRIIVRKKATPGMKAYALYRSYLDPFSDNCWDYMSLEQKVKWEKFSLKLKECL